LSFFSCHSESVFFMSAGLDCKVFIWNEKFEMEFGIEGLLKAKYKEAVKIFNKINQIPTL
jgi:hypothetical protein